ncbi:ImmA/IrrE family metallo-endopeptidase [Domibacillus sp. A3M-37]|nr:ImmA/IrrE family metallo-endopeptidase [Domibacillus sp. A3M-37]MCP3763897.1 ImmA/IrrE family metallo-endopeptidase [Domibacillus sp. A3M-37]
MGAVSYILLNNQLTEQQKWQDFAHELCHFLRHAGNHKALPFSFEE